MSVSATVTKLQPSKASKGYRVERITLTPAVAAQLLERNPDNRPISDQHVKMLARQITEGKWKLNGESIKISDEGNVLDGQNRLWAVIEANTPIDTFVVYGIKRDAFATIDTLRKPRSGGDMIALNGQARHRATIASALSWLIRWQGGKITEYRAPENKVDNADIEHAFKQHPDIVRAVEQASAAARRVCNASLMSFWYYVLSNRDEALADRMLKTLSDPAGISHSDPYFVLRGYFLLDHHRSKDPLNMIAVMIKATNAAHEGRRVTKLYWRSHGKGAEAFPTLEV